MGATAMNALMMLTPKSEVTYIQDTTTVRTALSKMFENGYTAIPVITNEGLYAGAVSEGDFLRFLLSREEEGMLLEYGSARVRQIMRPDFIPAVTANVDTDTLIRRAAEQNFIPVTDDRGTFIGIVTRKSVIGWLHGLTEKEEPPSRTDAAARAKA